MIPSDSVSVPEYYIVRKGYDDVMGLMELNAIDLQDFGK